MINDISKLFEMNPKYITDFLKNCIIEEKIDTHYITVEILTNTKIRVMKPNGKEVDRVDLILNGMWHKVLIDWNFLIVTNNDWFARHIGYKIRMFYFPSARPIMTEYIQDLRYVFDTAIFRDTEYNPEELFKDMVFPMEYKIGYKKTFKNNGSVKSVDMSAVRNGDIDIKELMRSIISNREDTFAVSEPEGYIYKWHKRLFQDCSTFNRNITSEKSSYEFLLADFIKYCKLNDYTSKLGQSYTKSVCDIFNDYIINNEKKTHRVGNNIDIDSIESPYLGQKFDLGYEYIPNPITKSLCRESRLYKNMFKVLIANLRKGKDAKHCILLSKKEVDEWNTIVKNIKIRYTYL